MATWFDSMFGRAAGGPEGSVGGDGSRADGLAELGVVLDSMPDWVFQVDRAGSLVGSNAPRKTPFPRVTEEHVGKPVKELFPDKAAGVLVTLIERTFVSGRANTFEYTFGPETKISYAEMRICPAGPDRIVCVVRDMTGRKSTEATLRLGMERYGLAVQGANDGLWDWQITTNKVYYSLQWKTMLGLEAKDVGSSPDEWFKRIHEEDVQGVRRALKKHLRGDSARFESEHRIHHSDGSLRWVLSRGMAVRNSRGEATRIAGSLTDLTNRRVVAAASEKSALLEHATSAVGIGIAIVLPSGALTRLSPTLVVMVEAWDSADDWWKDVRQHFALPPAVPCPHCSSRQHVGTVIAETEEPGGEFRVFEIAFTGHAHEVHHGSTAHALLVEDVTEQKIAEIALRDLNTELIVARDRALASSRAKSTFLANMSHELRTPLNAIIGYSEMLVEELEDEGVEVGVAELGKIHAAGKQLLELISDVLDLSKIEAGVMEMHSEEFDVRELLASITDKASASAATAGIDFESRIPADLGLLQSDPGKLHQVLMNLLDNACKFTSEGKIELVASTREDDTVVVEVIDTGIGMDDEMLARLFDEFFQGDLSYTKRFGGAGLGLAVSRRFVDLMGGTIEVESAPGEGSTFRVILPRRVPTEDAVEEAHPAFGGVS